LGRNVRKDGHVVTLCAHFKQSVYLEGHVLKIACLNADLISFITVCTCAFAAVTSISGFKSIFPPLMEVSVQSRSKISCYVRAA
jgi:hypothetical protein